jgi:SAM-dependent methyltransferase
LCVKARRSAKRWRAVASRSEEDAFGAGLRPGSEHYRAYVGWPEHYDLIAGLQFTLLFKAGLRETHRLLDLGCGSLRGGRLFIPYLRPGHYFGVEPNEWLVREAIERELGADMVRLKRPIFSTIADFDLARLGERFDFVLAQSVFSHTFGDLARKGLSGVRDCLADGGVLLATFFEREHTAEGSGWQYPANVPYTYDAFSALASNAGIAVHRLEWPHPRQTWFAGALDPATAARVATTVASTEGL